MNLRITNPKRFFKVNAKHFLAAVFVAVAFVAIVPSSARGPATAVGEYNPGPDPETPAGRALIDIYAELPEYMEMSRALMAEQKFRYIFGLMMTRTRFEPNAVKILFIGQDATHIAEASKQPGTSGFGARVQSIGHFFGVDQGVATTNAFLSTIKGQYGSFDHLYVEEGADGEPQFRKSSYVDSELWMLANGRESEIRTKREAFWEWMIKNNPDSMRLFVAFGGAARDAFAEFLVARGAEVETRIAPEQFRRIQVPETRLEYAGGNNEFPVPITNDGKDVYEILVGEKLDYSKEADQARALQALQGAGRRAVDLMVFTGGGFHGSGVMHPAQLGGYNLDKVKIKGHLTNSLKGLVLSDGTVVRHDIAFTMSPHPSALSKMENHDASIALKKAFARLNSLKQKGWRIEPDLDDTGVPLRNLWHEGEEYKYGRADIRPGYFEFGAPDDRRVSRADASRLDPQTIVAGTRNRVKFDPSKLEAMKKAVPSEKMDSRDLWSVRPRQADTRYVFDRGPGPELARKLEASLDRDLLFEPKLGMRVTKENGQDGTFDRHGIDAYYTKTHPGTGLFGHFRGSFDGSKVLILADPHGLDDWNTSRALTGARGQFLHGLMRDLGVGDEYLVIKTVPVGMDGASDGDWEVIRKRTESYREVAIEAALSQSRLQFAIADGPIAQVELRRILKKKGVRNLVVFDLNRLGMNPESGLKDLVSAMKKAKPELATKQFRLEMVDLPRRHLPWWARTWEGTSGDRVLDAEGKERGRTRALVTPDWVAKQKVKPSPRVQDSIRRLLEELDQAGVRADAEAIQDFLRRKGLGEGRYRKRPPQRTEVREVRSTVFENAA